jgi:uncharacterized protein
MVTVTEIDLARKRIALSMRSRPEIGPKTPLGGVRPPAGLAGGNRSAAGTPRAVSPAASQSLNSDWFTAALNRKK